MKLRHERHQLRPGWATREGEFSLKQKIESVMLPSIRLLSKLGDPLCIALTLYDYPTSKYLEGSGK